MSVADGVHLPTQRRARGSTPSLPEVLAAQHELAERVAASRKCAVDQLTGEDLEQLTPSQRRLLDYNPDDPDCARPTLEAASPSRRLGYKAPLTRRRKSREVEHDPWSWENGVPDVTICGPTLHEVTPTELRLLGKRTVRVYRQLHRMRGRSTVYLPLGVSRLATQLKLPYRTLKRCLSKLRLAGAIDSCWRKVKHVDGTMATYWETWLHVRVWGSVDLRRGVMRLLLPSIRFGEWVLGRRPVGRPKAGSAAPREGLPLMRIPSKAELGPMPAGPYLSKLVRRNECTYRQYKRANSTKDPKDLKTRREWEAEHRSGREIHLGPNYGPPNVHVRVNPDRSIHAKLRDRVVADVQRLNAPVVEANHEVASKQWPALISTIESRDPKSSLSENTKGLVTPSDRASSSRSSSEWAALQKDGVLLGNRVGKAKKPPMRPEKVKAIPGPHPVMSIGPMPTQPVTSTRRALPTWFMSQVPPIERVDIEQVVADTMLPFDASMPALYRLDQLVESYREAVLIVWDQESWAFVQKRASAMAGVHRNRLLTAVEFMTNHDMAPLSWFLWALRRFKEEGASKPQSILHLCAYGLLDKWRGWYKGTKDDPYPVRAKLTQTHLEQLYRRKEAVRRMAGIPIALIWSALPGWYVRRRLMEISSGFEDALELWPIVHRKPGQPARVDRRPRPPQVRSL